MSAIIIFVLLIPVDFSVEETPHETCPHSCNEWQAHKAVSSPRLPRFGRSTAISPEASFGEMKVHHFLTSLTFSLLQTIPPVGGRPQWGHSMKMKVAT